MPPLLDIDPKYYVTPILHLLIGLVNKAWQSMIHFFDEFVENVSNEEAKIKDEKVDIENKLAYLDDEIDIHTVTKMMALEANSETEMETSEINKLYKQSIKISKDLNKEKRANCRS